MSVNEQDYEVRVKYEDGIMVSAKSKDEAIEKARAAFLEDSNKEIIAQMQFKVSEFN
ncbi:MAG: hypothetical protein JHD34_03990 [Candidatus Nanopelagicus sp.]|nr:hypothetical protein [Candidatus Nanopelagicus sp.]